MRIVHWWKNAFHSISHCHFQCMIQPIHAIIYKYQNISNKTMCQYWQTMWTQLQPFDGCAMQWFSFIHFVYDLKMISCYWHSLETLSFLPPPFYLSIFGNWCAFVHFTLVHLVQNWFCPKRENWFSNIHRWIRRYHMQFLLPSHVYQYLPGIWDWILPSFMLI